MNIEDIAPVCYAANAAYCRALGDNTQSCWGDAPQWQRDSVINGVQFHLDNPHALPSASHDSWFAEKDAAGWVYGPVKNPETKEHPCMVPFHRLPEDQQRKDKLFKAIVDALR